MNRCLRVGLGIAVTLLLGVQTADAGLTLSFRFDQTNYNVAAGGTVAVEVLLRQTGSPGAGQTNVLGGSGAVGLTGTGVRVTFPTGPNDAQVLSTADIAGNVAFDNFGFDPFTTVNGGSALLSQATSGAPVLGTLVAPGTYDLLLGTFSFTAGTVAGQVTPISAAIPLFQNSNDNVAATSPPTVLSTIAGAGATITVGPTVASAAPEPRTLLPCLAGVALIVGLARRRRAVLVP